MSTTSPLKKDRAWVHKMTYRVALLHSAAFTPPRGFSASTPFLRYFHCASTPSGIPVPTPSILLSARLFILLSTEPFLKPSIIVCAVG